MTSRNDSKLPTLVACLLLSACGDDSAGVEPLPTVPTPAEPPVVMCVVADASVRPGDRCGCSADCEGDPATRFCIRESVAGTPGGECTDACVEDGDCPGGAVCIEGLCEPPCETSADCGEEGICFQGGCQRWCREDADCDSGRCNPYRLSCAEGPDEGGGVLAPCEQADDCRSDRCLAITEGGSPVCIVLCDARFPDTCPVPATDCVPIDGDVGLCL